MDKVQDSTDKREWTRPELPAASPQARPKASVALTPDGGGGNQGS